jgi:hypothetical protein
MEKFRMKLAAACLLTLGLILAISTNSNAQEKVWERKIGGSNFDIIRDVQETNNEDYIFVGSTKSYGKGGSDVWVGITDSMGNMIWDKYFGGKDDEEGYSIKQTIDGGYIVAGSTKSIGAGKLDVYVFKIDSKGSIVWERPFGGSGDDEAFSVYQTGDDGYIVTGYTKSNAKGGKDLWVIKLNPQGDREWDKTFGSSFDDEGRDIIELREGGYVATGYTTTPGGSGRDLWILELDKNGNKIGDYVLDSGAAKSGRPPEDIGYSVKETNDGSYVIAGTTESTPNNPDFWVIKANSRNKIWDRKFGGNKPDDAFSVDVTKDGGFIIAGRSKSFSADFNVWLVRADPEGSELWNLTFGGSGDETAYSAKATSDDKYIVSGLVGGMGQGGDGWLIKVKDPQEIPIAYYPSGNGFAIDNSGQSSNGTIEEGVNTNITTKKNALIPLLE